MHSYNTLAIFALVVVHTIFIVFGQPDSSSSTSTTKQPDVHANCSNETCNPSKNITCKEEFFCVLVNNATEGKCCTWNWEGMEAYSPPNDSSEEVTSLSSQAHK
ncbi:evasin P1126-like [Dermacentor silvarum]|uniref:evasin P1126-like n=1 Tax=Dermacentor silvarum TaxID=543639 RepID=UPI0021007BD4|nr:evasin P1126-like [Dermacentor silvarum]